MGYLISVYKGIVSHNSVAILSYLKINYLLQMALSKSISVKVCTRSVNKIPTVFYWEVTRHIYLAWIERKKNKYWEGCWPPPPTVFIFYVNGGQQRESVSDLSQVFPFQVESWPNCSQYTLSVTPKSIWKSYGFLMFSEGREVMHWEQMG